MLAHLIHCLYSFHFLMVFGWCSFVNTNTLTDVNVTVRLLNNEYIQVFARGKHFDFWIFDLKHSAGAGKIYNVSR